MIEVELPDGTIAEFPDGTANDVIKQALQKRFSPTSQPAMTPETGGYGNQIFSGLVEGATGALGAPVDMMNNLVVAPAVKGVNAIFGTDYKADNPLGGSQGLRQGMDIAPASQEVGPQMARRVAQSVGGAAVPLAGTGGSAAQIAAGLATGAAGGAGGAIANQLFPDNATADIVGELAGGLAGGAAISGMASRSARKAAEAAVPSVENLKDSAKKLYKQAEEAGVTASIDQTTQLAADFKKIAVDEGLISPTGRVSEAYPRAAEALRVMDDYAKGTMTPTQMLTVRDILSDAAQATEGKEQRIATIMLKQFDGFTAPLAPPLAEARKLYSQAMRGDQLETLKELAGSRAGQFTGSGFENALRTEYRGLERKIIKGQERGWSPEQQQAISNVARGTPLSNTARNVGRLAPTGPVSFAASTGVPFGIGNAMGGPAVGAAAAAGVSGAAYGSRALATQMGIRNAEIAELLARGGALNPGADPEIQKRIIEALMGSQAAAQATMQ